MGCLVLAASAGIASAQDQWPYAEWTAGGPNAGTADTPHRDYRTTTVKCAVCHAVHNAAWYTTDDGTPEGSMTSGVAVPGSPSELLLRTSVADACTYCHIETAIGSIVIYGGNKDLYLYDDKHGHQVEGGVSCVDCHAVHGAGTFQFDGGYSGFRIAKNLKVFKIRSDVASDFAGGDVQRLIEATATLTTPNGDEWQPGEYTVVAYCTQCHATWSMNSEDLHESTEGTATVFIKTHPLRTTLPVFEAQGASSEVTKVANGDTRDCLWWCHAQDPFVDKGPGVHLDDFPHYNSRTQRFVYADGYDVADASADGVCIQSGCHQWRDGETTRGVGIDY